MSQNTLDITCSNISFVGQGKDKTTVHGGIDVWNKKNVTVKNLTLTNPNEDGLHVEGEEASVDLLHVSVKECGRFGLFVMNGASVIAPQCEYCENRQAGVVVFGGSKGIFTDKGNVVELRGEQTEIHHNNQSDLRSRECHYAYFNIYLHPITIHHCFGS